MEPNLIAKISEITLKIWEYNYALPQLDTHSQTTQLKEQMELYVLEFQNA
jgi:hypothetical protein